MPSREFEPQVHGCGRCRDGREPCDARPSANAGEWGCNRLRWQQAQQAADQGPFKEHGVYLSQAEREAVDRLQTERQPVELRKAELAAIANCLTAEENGDATWADAAEALAKGDNVNLPQHYASFKHEPIRFIVENGLNWFQGNIVKYASRAEKKHATPLEDIRKIGRYAEMWHDYAAGDANWWMARGAAGRA